ncbi:hypothetical protein MPTK1_2g22000 [Marchantia polymorpha subsp. ruderalis]|uniref:Profilin n=1 Tax=Marchantia polymorpha TaxID=3197 RepID=A0A2R6X2J4_MARPO|nr:hypothetical protein MARPO_0040s0015 [Marchantia polymorpha]BBN03247.1 hypothetical protein Mp_2g22000 [Marchantia polymorpha subsp. ruderalis]|eukprot:PTQ40330.1 hypothetical protein MARPO_0040s0015 [Marchantia polymorpha]
MGERAMLHRLWDKWSSIYVAPDGGKALCGAAVVNLASDRPIRFPGLVLEQEGMELKSADVRPIIAGVRDYNLQNECIVLDSCKYFVTATYENMYCARREDAPTLPWGGAIIGRTPAYLVISKYQGTYGAAAKALAATEVLMEQITPRSS